MSKLIRVINDNNFPLTDITKDTIKRKSASVEENNQNLFSKKEMHTFTANGTFENIAEWQQYIDNVFPVGDGYLNHNIGISMMEDATTDLTNTTDKSMNVVRHEFHRVESIINYQNASGYFSYIEQFDEKELPMIYTEFIDGEQNEVLSKQVITQQKPEKKIFTNFDPEFTINMRPRTSEMLAKHSNILFSCDYKYTTKHQYKDMFPIYNQINFSTGINSSFLDMLEEFGFYRSFVNHYIKNDKTPLLFSIVNQTDDVTDVSYNILDVSSVIKDMTSYLEDNNKLMLPDVETESHIERNVKKYAFLGRLRNLSKQKNRNFSEIVTGEFAEHEFIFYKIDKYIGDNLNQDPINSFWCSSKRDIVNLIDTQVKPKRTYTYTVKGYSVVFGSSYSINSTKVYEAFEKYYCDIETTVSPSYQIVEIPLFRKTISVNLHAPLRPYVHFISKMKRSNNFKLLLDTKTGSVEEDFISITTTDDQRIQSMKTVKQNTFLFQYTKEPGMFEIYRTRILPTSYGDFQRIAPNIAFNEQASAVITNEYVVPNTKYYYMFRTVSTTGLVSNPSSIYEVELRRDADESKLFVQVIKLRSRTGKQHTIPMRRLLRIAPAPDQEFFEGVEELDTYTDGDIKNLPLGTTEEAVWGRKFKIRLKSKGTGKKIDFNILFNLHKIKSTEDFS